MGRCLAQSAGGFRDDLGRAGRGLFGGGGSPSADVLDESFEVHGFLRAPGGGDRLCADGQRLLSEGREIDTVEVVRVECRTTRTGGPAEGLRRDRRVRQAQLLDQQRGPRGIECDWRVDGVHRRGLPFLEGAATRPGGATSPSQSLIAMLRS